MIAIIYTRYSPKPKHKEHKCETLETQEAICRAYCERMGLEVVEVIADADTSARTIPFAKRDGGAKLLKKLNGHAIVAYRLDRVFRNVADGMATLRDWRDEGVILHSATSGCSYATNTPDGWLTVIMQLVMAEYEPLVTAFRTKHAMQRRQASGQIMGGNPPYGLEADPKEPGKYRANREEKKVRDLMYSLQGDGLNPHDIARYLNERHYKNRSGNDWQPRSIDRILEGSPKLAIGA